MPNPTDVTVLYTDSNSHDVWVGEYKPSHIKLTSYKEFQETETDLPHTLVINGHSDVTNKLANLTAQQIAEMLAAKYGDKKSELKTLCLMACETSVIQVGQEASFATSLANELNILGFRDVIVHAPPAVQPGNRSRLRVYEGYKMGTNIYYYEIPPKMEIKFDSDIKNKRFLLRFWERYKNFSVPKFPGFPDNYIDATVKYFASPVLQIQDNINQFYSKVWKELYDLFDSFGSQILNAKLQVVPDFQKLQQTYNELKELDNTRGLYQKNIDESAYKTTIVGAVTNTINKAIGSNFKPKSSITSIGQFENFLAEDLFLQCNKGLKTIPLDDSRRTDIQESNTVATLINPVNGKEKVVAKDLLTFSDKCREKMEEYQKLQSEVLKNTQMLKTQLLSKVKKYNTDDLRPDKKAVMDALEKYLSATTAQEIKKMQEALFTAMHNNPNWNEGLISKRSRTAVESALEIMQIEDRPGTYTPKMK